MVRTHLASALFKLDLTIEDLDAVAYQAYRVIQFGVPKGSTFRDAKKLLHLKFALLNRQLDSDLHGVQIDRLTHKVQLDQFVAEAAQCGEDFVDNVRSLYGSARRIRSWLWRSSWLVVIRSMLRYLGALTRGPN